MGVYPSGGAGPRRNSRWSSDAIASGDTRHRHGPSVLWPVRRCTRSLRTCAAASSCVHTPPHHRSVRSLSLVSAAAGVSTGCSPGVCMQYLAVEGRLGRGCVLEALHSHLHKATRERAQPVSVVNRCMGPRCPRRRGVSPWRC